MAAYQEPVNEIPGATNRFKEDVLQGLSAERKFLQSKYLYDAEGDRLFQQIMNVPEYYPARCEMEILSRQTENIGQALLDGSKEIDIIELGAGDAAKSVQLLRYFSEADIAYTYYPIDISEHAIRQLETDLPKRLPGIRIHGVPGEFLETIPMLNTLSARKKVYLFLGSTIGNFTKTGASVFLNELRSRMNIGDLLLVGFDLKKNPKQILAAYNDKAGITKAFNLNLLERINRELHGKINITTFDHFPTYDPVSGECKSYLISLREQDIQITDQRIHFDENEPVYMELSMKYSREETDILAQSSGFQRIKHFCDTNKWFLDAVWRKI